MTVAQAQPRPLMKRLLSLLSLTCILACWVASLTSWTLLGSPGGEGPRITCRTVYDCR